MSKIATSAILIPVIALLSTAGFASADSNSGGSRFAPGKGARPSFGVKVCHAAPVPAHAESLAQMLADSSGGRFAAVDTYDIGYSGGHAAFPASEWYGLGYRAILVFSDLSPEDSVALGDSLARFIELGGGVVEAVFSDATDWLIGGTWRSTYAPFPVMPQSNTEGFMGTVFQPFHPVMAGVSELYVGCYRTGSRTGALRSPNCATLSEWTDSSRCLAASFDSAGRRAVSLGMCPVSYWETSATGQWCRMIVNALNWVAVGPSVGVTSPNGGESWRGGTVHDITWTQTDNGVRDSIYYSTDAGASWTGLAYLDTPPVPLQYAWTLPDTPTAQARVKVVTWDEDGGRVEDRSDADFTIASSGIVQPEKSVLPAGLVLYQPSPNPLASGAAVRYVLPRPAQVELRIYNAAGTLVRPLVDGHQPAGNRSAYWDGRDDLGRPVAPGVYYCRFRAADFTAVQKLVVQR
ncbi:T9SS type A sorting domain-containing protein [candidate division WOR-3 bacterium]|nr:T9SS type A sorting domain-containing protein [candidate division WOR-3 bacterium]